MHKAWCNAHGALQHGEPHGAMAMEHGAQATWEWCTCTRHIVQGMVRWNTGHGAHASCAWCIGHGAQGMGNVVQGMVHVQGVTNHGSRGMLHDA